MAHPVRLTLKHVAYRAASSSRALVRHFAWQEPGVKKTYPGWTWNTRPSQPSLAAANVAATEGFSLPPPLEGSLPGPPAREVSSASSADAAYLLSSEAHELQQTQATPNPAFLRSLDESHQQGREPSWDRRGTQSQAAPTLAQLETANRLVNRGADVEGLKEDVTRGEMYDWIAKAKKQLGIVTPHEDKPAGKKPPPRHGSAERASSAASGQARSPQPTASKREWRPSSAARVPSPPPLLTTKERFELYVAKGAEVSKPFEEMTDDEQRVWLADARAKLGPVAPEKGDAPIPYEQKRRMQWISRALDIPIPVPEGGRKLNRGDAADFFSKGYVELMKNEIWILPQISEKDRALPPTRALRHESKTLGLGFEEIGGKNAGEIVEMMRERLHKRGAQTEGKRGDKLRKPTETDADAVGERGDKLQPTETAADAGAVGTEESR
ncbi:hypothetical protein CALVIDRAFT_538103 [Calocera viscosa TUFC12733]|uniref:Uncharacterized protein n=1 Tax=Calocera viscosa (strain TUFC12733) TaxID=1330018 RepID=A0A167L4H8_CALVF|nr:hypothetical protein CALVIDRAFT_538103 [Calocera viscosa TUFC12733]